MVQHEMSTIFQTFTVLRFLQLLYRKIKRSLGRLFGRRDSSRRSDISLNDLELIWDQQDSAWGWIPVCLTLAIGYTIIRHIWRRLHPVKATTNEEDKKEGANAKHQEQQQQQQQMMMMQTPGGYGGYGSGMNSMYGGTGLYGLNSMHGSSMYGGGLGTTMYGSGLYGSRYGRGMYGAY